MSYIHGKSIIKIAVADDHEMFREAISAIIDGFENCKVVAQAATGIELLDCLQQKSNIDLVLLDISMPEMDGYDAANKIHKQFPEVKIVFCSMYNSELAVCRMIGIGASGYVDKTASTKELKKTIYQVMKNDHGKEIHNGKIFFYHDGGNGHHDLKTYKVSDEEIRFLKLICTEKPYKVIANEMNISERQVDYIRESLFYRFDVHSRIGLAVIANQSGVHSLVTAIKTFIFLFHFPLEFYP